MIDPRIIRVGVEINGALTMYENIKIRASGSKYASSVQNECTVVLTSISRQARDFILTETSPFNENRTPKKLIVEVGRRSYGFFRLFEGDIVSAIPSYPPDLDLTIKAKTSNSQTGNIVSVSSPALSRLSVISQRVASDLGLSLNFQATDKNISSYTHTGSALAQVKKLEQSGDISAYIDDQELVVKDRILSLSGQLIILNKNSGMVGIPKADAPGLKVEFLVVPQARIGGALRIDSEINIALNGDYIIDQLNFDVATHDTPFFYTAICRRI